MARLLTVRCRDIFLKGGDPTFRPARLSDFVPVQLAPTLPKSSSVFQTDVGESVPDPVKFLQQHGGKFIVYSVDVDQRVLGLVKVKEGIDIKTAPFLYQTQRANAEELLLLPFDVLPAVADTLTETLSSLKNIFLYNTGRCGSTLMCKAMDVINDVQAVSEPNVFQVIIERVCTEVPVTFDEKEEIIMLLRCSVILLNFYFLQKDPSKKVVCYKFRSEAIFIADLIQNAAPEAKTIFMYRDLAGFYDSNINLHFNGSYWRYLFETTLRLDVFFRVPARKTNLPIFKFFDEHPRMITCPVTHGMHFLQVSSWTLQMQKAFDLIQEDLANFFHACLTFKYLLEHKERIILKVLEKLDVDVPSDLDSSKIREVFGVDSQKGSVMQSERRKGDKVRSSWVGTWEKNLFSTVLEHFNGDVDEPDFVMPNTMMLN
ncbi:Hypp4665 [Branchiostoma lanceolatum]|uniref:Hypp4665 protein n=1 Tax=Branchiostoma lanceolatum TaxID=7740 RepID=A0A8K0AAY8_BRALA|nr:Hypp4665 [Branchiostoma lanceolatum]